MCIPAIPPEVDINPIPGLWHCHATGGRTYRGGGDYDGRRSWEIKNRPGRRRAIIRLRQTPSKMI
jgi:hypothetical protein